MESSKASFAKEKMPSSSHNGPIHFPNIDVIQPVYRSSVPTNRSSSPAPLTLERRLDKDFPVNHYLTRSVMKRCQINDLPLFEPTRLIKGRSKKKSARRIVVTTPKKPRKPKFGFVPRTVKMRRNDIRPSLTKTDTPELKESTQRQHKKSIWPGSLGEENKQRSHSESSIQHKSVLTVSSPLHSPTLQKESSPMTTATTVTSEVHTKLGQQSVVISARAQSKADRKVLDAGSGPRSSNKRKSGLATKVKKFAASITQNLRKSTDNKTKTSPLMDDIQNGSGVQWVELKNEGVQSKHLLKKLDNPDKHYLATLANETLDVSMPTTCFGRGKVNLKKRRKASARKLSEIDKTTAPKMENVCTSATSNQQKSVVLHFDGKTARNKEGVSDLDSEESDVPTNPLHSGLLKESACAGPTFSAITDGEPFVDNGYQTSSLHNTGSGTSVHASEEDLPDCCPADERTEAVSVGDVSESSQSTGKTPQSSFKPKANICNSTGSPSSDQDGKKVKKQVITFKTPVSVVPQFRQKMLLELRSLGIPDGYITGNKLVTSHLEAVLKERMQLCKTVREKITCLKLLTSLSEEASIIIPQSSESGDLPLRRPTGQEPNVASVSSPFRQPSVTSVVQPPRQPSLTSVVQPPRQPSLTSVVQPPRQSSTTSAVQSSRQPLGSAVSPPPRHPSVSAAAPPPRQLSVSAVSPPPRQPSVSAAAPPSKQPSVSAAAPPSKQPSAVPSPRQPSVSAVAPPPRQPSLTSVVPPPRQPSMSAVALPPRQPTVSAAVSHTRQPSVSAAVPPPRQPSVSAVAQPPRQPTVSAAVPPPMQPSVSAEAPTPRQPSVSAAAPQTRQPTVSAAVPPPRQPSVSAVAPPPRQRTVSAAVSPPRQPSVPSAVQPHRQSSAAPPPRQSSMPAAVPPPRQSSAAPPPKQSSTAPPPRQPPVSSSVPPPRQSSAAPPPRQSSVSAAAPPPRQPSVSSAVPPSRQSSAAPPPRQSSVLAAVPPPRQSSAAPPPRQSSTAPSHRQPPVSSAVPPPKQSSAAPPPKQSSASAAVPPLKQPSMSTAVPPPRQSSVSAAAPQPRHPSAVPSVSAAAPPPTQPSVSAAVPSPRQSSVTSSLQSSRQPPVTSELQPPRQSLIPIPTQSSAIPLSQTITSSILSSSRHSVLTETRSSSSHLAVHEVDPRHTSVVSPLSSWNASPGSRLPRSPLTTSLPAETLNRAAKLVMPKMSVRKNLFDAEKLSDLAPLLPSDEITFQSASCLYPSEDNPSRKRNLSETDTSFQSTFPDSKRLKLTEYCSSIQTQVIAEGNSSPYPGQIDNRPLCVSSIMGSYISSSAADSGPSLPISKPVSQQWQPPTERRISEGLTQQQLQAPQQHLQAPQQQLQAPQQLLQAPQQQMQAPQQQPQATQQQMQAPQQQPQAPQQQLQAPQQQLQAPQQQLQAPQQQLQAPQQQLQVPQQQLQAPQQQLQAPQQQLQAPRQTTMYNNCERCDVIWKMSNTRPYVLHGCSSNQTIETIVRLGGNIPKVDLDDQNRVHRDILRHVKERNLAWWRQPNVYARDLTFSIFRIKDLHRKQFAFLDFTKTEAIKRCIKEEFGVNDFFFKYVCEHFINKCIRDLFNKRLQSIVQECHVHALEHRAKEVYGVTRAITEV